VLGLLEVSPLSGEPWLQVAVGNVACAAKPETESKHTVLLLSFFFLRKKNTFVTKHNSVLSFLTPHLVIQLDSAEAMR